MMMFPMQGLPYEGQASISLMTCAVILWCFNILPLSITSILCIILVPILGITSSEKIFQYFSDPMIFFVFSMFINAIAFENSGISRKILNYIIRKSNEDPKTLSFYLIFFTALISSVLADIPAIAMIAPIAYTLLQENNCYPEKSNFGKLIMLGLPLSSLIGGIGTPMGSAMNVAAITMIDNLLGYEITFFQWMCIGYPIVLTFIPIMWYILVKSFPIEISKFYYKTSSDTKFTKKELYYICIFILNIILWNTTSIHNIPLAFISVIGSSLYCIPIFNLIDWNKDKNKINWDVILVLGAAIALSKCIWHSGGCLWIVNTFLSCINVDLFGFVIILSLFVVLIHLLIPVEIAIISVMIPTIISMCYTLGFDPIVISIIVAVNVSASLLLPLGPVPLVTYPYGYYKMYDLFKPGIILTVAWVILSSSILLFMSNICL